MRGHAKVIIFGVIDIPFEVGQALYILVSTYISINSLLDALAGIFFGVPCKLRYIKYHNK